jgi:hypothetical protein
MRGRWRAGGMWRRVDDGDRAAVGIDGIFDIRLSWD